MDKEQIAQDFSHLREDKRVLALLVYGSKVKGTDHERSDTDICVVAPEAETPDILLKALRNPEVQKKDYDVHVFEEMGVRLRHKVVEDHEIIWCRDLPKLKTYFHKNEKIWRDQAKARMEKGQKL
ncbi:MAG: nucleotidyltransferase domain-containing protein [Candidatus Nanohaloarchaea archaeon]|nr:nucleotidyltransferase domain-containing protein [Candidatus Nanohaloarchaea archaeon]